MKQKNILQLILSILICQLAGIIGSIFTSKSIPIWYANLSKPWFTPPDWVFGPVWITLYFLMGISLYLIISGGWKKNKVALGIFGIQLLLNALWSIIFFGLKLPALAFFELMLLWVFILVTITKFYQISKAAAYLLTPYLLWVSFAAILNFFITFM